MILAGVMIASLCSCGDSSSQQKGASGVEFVFDPGSVAELEIKGVQPDGTVSWGAVTVPAAVGKSEELLARGKELYSKACAACHGADGKGEGPLIARLEFNSRPANFTLPLRAIKIRSTSAGTLPADADLFRTVTRGLPGTAMLSFRELPEEERWALVMRIKEFWAGGKWPAPKVVEIPKKIPKDAELLELGRRMYGDGTANRPNGMSGICQNCHGIQGLGGAAASYNQQTGKMYPAIPFARGGGKFMFGGSSDEDIARTLLTGFSLSSPMMNFQPQIYGDEPNSKEIEAGNRTLWGTVYYTRQLIEAQK